MMKIVKIIVATVLFAVLALMLMLHFQIWGWFGVLRLTGSFFLGTVVTAIIQEIMSRYRSSK